MDVTLLADAGEVLARAGSFLSARPVEHNLILTLLHQRRLAPEEGRYWVVHDGSEIAGVVFQSPLTFAATVTPMSGDAADAAAEAAADAAPDLPGVNGEAATVARFAGRWTEVRATGARPTSGQRLYVLHRLTEPAGVPGRLRVAEEGDVPLLVAWMHGFAEETGETAADPDRVVRARVDARQFYVWDDGAPRSTAAASLPVAGVSRVQAVYTPPDLRARGYAGATVGAVSRTLLDRGLRCVLYTDLANPTSNSVYRRLGYRAVSEIVRYSFA